MAIKNNKSISLEALKSTLEKSFPDYNFEINGNALTVIYAPNTKLNIVAVGEEFWTVEAVPFNFKMVIVIFCIATFAYWVQQQGWHWGINIVLYAIAFVALGYIANWLYGLLYQRNYQKFKPQIIQKIKEMAE